METVRIRDPGWEKMKIRDKHPGSATLHIGTGSVADPDPGSGAFLTPGSGIRNRFFPDPGSQGSGIRDKHPGSATLGTGTLIVTQKGKDNMENLRIIPLNILL